LAKTPRKNPLPKGVSSPNRQYVSRHTYRTPTGLYYDDRTGKRLTGARGRSNAANASRMKARVRDESGRLSFIRVKGKSDIRNLAEKKKRETPDEADFESDSVYDPDINETLASQYVESRLDAEDPGFAHFNVQIEETLEASA